MNKIFLVVLLPTMSFILLSQITKENICGKKWYPDRYKEADGKIYPFDKETKLLFTKFNCDGTFESWEDRGVFVKGTWVLDENTSWVKIKSKNTKITMDDSVKIVSCSGEEMVFEKIDAGGDKITIFSKAK